MVKLPPSLIFKLSISTSVEITGLLPLPEETSSIIGESYADVVLGTVFHDQFAAVPQSVLEEPSHVFLYSNAPISSPDPCGLETPLISVDGA